MNGNHSNDIKQDMPSKKDEAFVVLNSTDQVELKEEATCMCLSLSVYLFIWLFVCLYVCLG